MTVTTHPAPAEALLELEGKGIVIDVIGDQLRLRPTVRTTPEIVQQVRACKAELMPLLADPRRRWREQAEALLTTVGDPVLREDLLSIFDEREAVASVNGGLGDDEAGRLAYEQLAVAVAASGPQEKQTSGT